MSNFNKDAYEALSASIYKTYADRVPESESWYKRASKSLVGGVSGTVRYFKPFPLYFAEGSGSHTTDIDGNDYIDHFLCGACLLLGHRPEVVMSAINQTSKSGSLILNNKLSTELAELMQELIPCAERVRLLNSGTEAVMSALRFARAFTGRSKIIKFHGTYHGQGDDMLFGLDHGDRRIGGGITDAAISQTILATLGDFEGLEKLLATKDIAAILVDPSMHHCGLWTGSSEDYAKIKQMAHAAGTLLIFDEVISGFRIASGGAQTYFDVKPDLAIFGKAFGAGEKIGAVVGREDVMAVADPARSRPGPFAYQSGTGNDVTNSVSASIAALKQYQQLDGNGEYNKISERAQRLGQGLKATFSKHGIACHFTQLGPMVRLFLTNGPRTYANCIQLNLKAINLFHLALITEGVLTIPGSNDFFLSFAHTDADIQSVVDAADRVLSKFDFNQITPLLENSEKTCL